MHFLLAVLGTAVAFVFLASGVGAAINATCGDDRPPEGPLRPTRAGLSCFFREVAAHLLTGALLPLGLRQDRPRPSEFPEAAAGRVPVVFVPGYGLNRGTFLFFAAWMRRRGWRWVWAVNNRPISSPIPVFSRHLGQHVDEIRRVSGAEKVDLVCHSMGGLVAAWYVNRMGGAPFVRRLVTLGTPWRGTRMHVWGRRREARDVAPDSEIVRGAASPRVPTTAIWSRSDALVIPVSHAMGPGTEPVELAWLGHLEMLYSARVWRLVADILTTPDPPAPVPPDPALAP